MCLWVWGGSKWGFFTLLLHKRPNMKMKIYVNCQYISNMKQAQPERVIHVGRKQKVSNGRHLIHKRNEIFFSPQ